MSREMLWEIQREFPGKYRGNTQGNVRNAQGNVEKMLREMQRNAQEKQREYPGNCRGNAQGSAEEVLREMQRECPGRCRGNVQGDVEGMSREMLREMQRECSGNAGASAPETPPRRGSSSAGTGRGEQTLPSLAQTDPTAPSSLSSSQFPQSLLQGCPAQLSPSGSPLDPLSFLQQSRDRLLPSPAAPGQDQP